MSQTSAQQIDTLIVGQGLAGSALAWRLHHAGQKVSIVDRNDASSSSRIAAGLLTPITGQRLTRYPEWERLFPQAASFYREIERITSTSFFHETDMVRLFATEDERKLFLEKHGNVADLTLCPTADLPISANAPFGGFKMKQAARLITDVYLEATRKYFAKRDAYHQRDLKLPADMVFQPSSISVPSMNLSCQRVIFCRGFEDHQNPWFRGVPFDAAKGEILTLHTTDWQEDRIVHGGIWIAPEVNHTVHVGATYDRNNLNQSPTDEGRQQLLQKLEELLPCSATWTILDHRAAVRPVIHGRQPRIGLHPQDERLGFMNGLGSRGALLSPYLAELMASLLIEGIPVKKKYDLHQKMELS